MAGDEPEAGAQRGEHRGAWIAAGAAVAAALIGAVGAIVAAQVGDGGEPGTPRRLDEDVVMEARPDRGPRSASDRS